MAEIEKKHRDNMAALYAKLHAEVSKYENRDNLTSAERDELAALQRMDKLARKAEASNAS